MAVGPPSARGRSLLAWGTGTGPRSGLVQAHLI